LNLPHCTVLLCATNFVLSVNGFTKIVYSLVIITGPHRTRNPLLSEMRLSQHYIMTEVVVGVLFVLDRKVFVLLSISLYASCVTLLKVIIFFHLLR